MTFRSTTLILAVAGCLSADAAMAAATPVTAADFTATHVGKCIVYTGPSEGRQCFAADGRATYDDKTYGTDTGSWKVEGDKVCVSWDAEPGFSCAAWTRDGDAFSDGAYRWTIE